ncbi:MAG: acylneuraminate cytidylyltransferase [Deltaproteobacteria bacterium]|nr:acylneuraminate cytidylyltransferase [Deltaproteobacteria bacterium]
MKLAAVLACRNQSSRLYAKPLQRLHVERGITILEHLVGQLSARSELSDIVLAISQEEENRIYVRWAEDHDLPYVLGDDRDVLARLIAGADLVDADHVFRVTSESPFPYIEDLPVVLRQHEEVGADYSGTMGLPDGAYYEIIRLDALKRSWNEGEERHRSELCTLFISEHPDRFVIERHDVPLELRRTDVRLTVDWPEDLIVMRGVYEGLGLSPEEPHSLERIVGFLDEHPRLNAVNNWIDSGHGRVWY